MKQLLLITISVGLFLSVSQGKAEVFDHSHAKFTSILVGHVENERVNYRKLKAAPEKLTAYLDSLASVMRPEFEGWEESQQIAFMVNLYNATTLKLIADHYPVKSIKKIGGLFSGPWDQKVVRLFGREFDLNHVEHGVLRKEYEEPRIHFALVCGAKGCPPLRIEAYRGADLEEQLNDQGRKFFSQRNKNKVDKVKRTIYLSPIFKWFNGDFEKKSGGIREFVGPYLVGVDLTKGDWRIRYTDYDWSLNE
ncbi:DUF547 domain-containing protein [Verrucomicrobia bacterium]|nr:DUF547 domain-containing protein [Verrucomicrobiota bacterium]